MKNNFNWLTGFKAMVGIASCVASMSVIYFGYGIGTEEPKKNAAAEAGAMRDKHRPVRAMNVALGDTVFFARDLGYAVKSANQHSADGGKIAARIESQLNGVRELYREEVAKNSALVGALVLQLTVGAAGEVRHVREVSARLPDESFKKAVAREAASWSFAEVVDQDVEVTCPLLFVREGMDITTIVQWEKSFRAAQADTPAQAPVASLRGSPSRRPAPAAQATFPPDTKFVQIRFATALRAEPNFSSPALTTLSGGTRVGLLRRHGEWLEVRSSATAPIGFIRRELVTPVEVRQ
jgi:hypothetical protein